MGISKYFFYPKGAVSNYNLLYFLSNYLSSLRGMLAFFAVFLTQPQIWRLYTLTVVKRVQKTAKRFPAGQQEQSQSVVLIDLDNLLPTLCNITLVNAGSSNDLWKRLL